jgi:hypothetical protein
MLLMFVAALFDLVMFARRWLHVLVIGVGVGVLGEALFTAEFGDRLIGDRRNAAIGARVPGRRARKASVRGSAGDDALGPGAPSNAIRVGPEMLVTH